MGPKFSIVSAFLAVSALFFILYVLRTRKLRGGFVVSWMMIAGIMISVPLAESFYIQLAGFVGLHRAIDMIIVVAVVFCLIYNFYLAVNVQRLNDQIQQLVSLVAILESDVEELSHNKRGHEGR